MSKSLQKQMKHFGSDTIKFQMLKNWSKNSNTKQVFLSGAVHERVLLINGLSGLKPKYNSTVYLSFLRKGEKIVSHGSVGIFTRIFLEIIIN